MRQSVSNSWLPFYSEKEVIILKEIQLNLQQVEAVSHKDGPMIVLSVAGSGKTMVLITVSILSFWYPKLMYSNFDYYHYKGNFSSPSL